MNWIKLTAETVSNLVNLDAVAYIKRQGKDVRFYFSNGSWFDYPCPLERMERVLAIVYGEEVQEVKK